MVASAKKGGRKSCLQALPALENNFADVVMDHTAGDPQRDGVVWTNLTSVEVAGRLADLGTPVCVQTVCGLFEHFGFARRQAEKTQVMGRDPRRDEQFRRIAQWKAEYLASDDPILSMDTKKKELLGGFFRPGRPWRIQPEAVFDHDFSSHATGRIIPHGLYDLKRNVGHLTIGVSHDTSQFACDSLRLWWRRFGHAAYPRARSLLLLCDGGGSNNCHHHIFKEDLQRLVNHIDLPIRVAHYPPYCSKYNPIEHRFFPHVTRAWSGMIFRSLEAVVSAARRISTRTGLRATVAVLNRAYELRRTATDRFLQAFPIQHDQWLGDWNYTVAPTTY